MSRLISLLLFVCFVSPVLGQESTPPANPAEAAAKDIAADLREARGLLKNVTDKATRERLELLLTRAELKTSDLQKTVSSLNVPNRASPATTDEFARLLKALRGESFDDGKVSFVDSYAKKGHLTSTQVRDLLKEFSFDDGRGKAAVALYPRCIDPQNYFMALETFSFDSNRKAVMAKLKLK